MKLPEFTAFLLKHAQENPVSFHMPGHKGSLLYRTLGYGDFLDHIMACDITEIPGADNMFQAEGVIEDIMKRYAALYEVEKSYLLINGTSGGLIASLLATVPKGGTVIMARNSHKSIFNALTLGGIKPVYAYPTTLEEYGIAGPILPEEIKRLLREHPEASAVVLPSPNYYGFCSDIEAIAKEVHKQGKVLIVDQAHGAHLKFFSSFAPGTVFGEGPMPLCAEDRGADLVVNSTHKTLASFTQSAVLNCNSARVDLDILEDKLQMIQSTSPSYLLMASLDINASILENHGAMLMEEWADNLVSFYGWAKGVTGLKMIMPDGNFDFTKLNIDFSEGGYSGRDLEDALNKVNIYPELNSGDLLMFMTGIGNSTGDYSKLTGAIKDLPFVEVVEAQGSKPLKKTLSFDSQNPPVRKTPPVKIVKVPLIEALGKTCGQSIIPYPPGIPLVCPGEVISQEAIEIVTDLRQAGEKVMGITPQGQVFVGHDAE